jgi:hypothetical protein
MELSFKILGWPHNKGLGTSRDAKILTQKLGVTGAHTRDLIQ